MKTHFIFDCDDVLLDWLGGFVKFLKANGYDVNPAGPNEWAMGSWIGCSNAEAKHLVEMFNASPGFGQLQSCEGAAYAVWSLRDAGHTMSVVTSCGESLELKQARRANIHRVFDRNGEGAFNRLTILPLGASKFDVLQSYARSHDTTTLRFVEDNFENAKAGIANGIISYCLRRPHNWVDEANDTGSGVFWITNLLHLQSREWRTHSVHDRQTGARST